MNHIIVKTDEHIKMFKQVLSEHKSVSKIEAIESGLMDRLASAMEVGATGKDPYLISWLFVDDDGGLLGAASLRLGQRVKCWYAKLGIATKLGRERFGVNAIFKIAFEVGFKFAEERGYYELYYHQRIGRHRQMEKTLQEAEYLKNYKIDLVETMPPFTPSVNPLINQFLLGPTSGLNPRPTVIVRIYNPEHVKYEYPYTQKN